MTRDPRPRIEDMEVDLRGSQANLKSSVFLKCLAFYRDETTMCRNQKPSIHQFYQPKIYKQQTKLQILH